MAIQPGIALFPLNATSVVKQDTLLQPVSAAFTKKNLNRKLKNYWLILEFQQMQLHQGHPHLPPQYHLPLRGF